jgi:hypothetical protein
MTTTRTDIHRPSAINPIDYEFVSYDYIGPNAQDVLGLAVERRVFQAHVAKTGGKFSTHEHGGTCHVCGASALYLANFYFRPTNTYIQVGEDCAEKFHLGSPSAFKRFRGKVHEGLAAKAGLRKAEAILTEAGLAQAWAVYNDYHARLKVPGVFHASQEETTIEDIVGKLVRYGSLSEKATNYLRSLVERHAQAGVRKAAQEAAKAAAAPVPDAEGRVKIVGEVVSVKAPEAYARFPTWKILIKAPEGYTLWGARPRSIAQVKRGDKVELYAAVQRSDRDEKFGFFSRPTKAVITEFAPEKTGA